MILMSNWNLFESEDSFKFFFNTKISSIASNDE